MDNLEKKSEPVHLDVTFHITLSREDIDDIMSAALDGGISYWCNRAEVVGEYLGTYASEQISHGGTLQLYADIEEDEPEVQELTLEKFLNGVKRYVAELNPGIVSDGKLDVCDIDAIAADSIIQFALFDEIVFA